jgi:hypothetical protein
VTAMDCTKGSSISGNDNEFYLSYRVQAGSTTNASSYAVGTGGGGAVCQGIRHPKHEADLPSFNAFLSAWSNTSSPPSPPGRLNIFYVRENLR